MKINYSERGILQIDDCRITHKNFSGKKSEYNREGDMNFSVVIPDEEIAEELRNDGWNVKIKPPYDADSDPFMYLPVKVKFNGRGPHIYVKTGNSMNKLDENEVHRIDKISIQRVDVDIRPYDWTANGKSGRTAYLQNLLVYQDIDRFAQRYAEEEFPEE